MAGDPRVLSLLEEMLDAGKSPEEVCRGARRADRPPCASRSAQPAEDRHTAFSGSSSASVHSRSNNHKKRRT
jgi:hypothetical protein